MQAYQARVLVKGRRGPDLFDEMARREAAAVSLISGFPAIEHRTGLRGFKGELRRWAFNAAPPVFWC